MIRRALAHRLPVFVALATFVLSFVSPIDAIQDLRPNDDTACGAIQLFTGHADMRVGTPTAAPASSHCPYCHFLRAVSGASAVAIISVTVPLVSQAPAPIPSPRILAMAVAHASSRAPPTSDSI